MENSTSDSIQNLESKQPVITVTLQINSNGNEVLHFEGASEDLDIDFTNSDQTTLRKLFRWLLDKELKQRTSLVLVKDPWLGISPIKKSLRTISETLTRR